MLLRNGATKVAASSRSHQGRCGAGVGYLGQQHGAAHALDQPGHGRLVARALDKVAFAVPRHQTVFDLGRAHKDAHPLADLAAAVYAQRTRQALGMALAQAGDAFAPQLALGVGVDGIVHRPVGHVEA